MKNIGLLCLFLMGLLIPATAQITITNAVFPAVGDTLFFKIDNQPQGIVMTAPGGPQQWDFSNLQASATWQQIFLPPQAGPESLYFPSANLLYQKPGGNVDVYLNASGNQVTMLGLSGPDPLLLGIDLVAQFNPPLVQQQAPLNFFDINQTSSGLLVPFSPGLLPGVGLLPFNADSMRIRVSISRLDAVNAFGTLAIPGGTFDVLRQQSTEYREKRLDAKIAPLGWLDVTDVAIQYLGLDLGVDTTVTYQFLSNQSKEPIAVCTTDNSQLLVVNVQYKNITAAPPNCANDTVSPTISCPGGQTLALGNNCSASLPNYTLLATANDNCGLPAVTQSPPAGSIVTGAGSVPVSLTATDNSGNTSSCTFTVTKVDNQPPNAICQNITVQPDGSGTVSILASQIDNGSNDACGIAGFALNANTFDCTQEGDNPVSLTVTDVNGNSSSCMAVVTVQCNPPLPGPLDSEDIGNAGAGNTYQYDPAQSPPAFNIQANSNNNSLNADNLALISQELCGDFAVTVRVQSVTPSGYAGVVAREDMAPGSRMVGMFSNLSNMVRFESRSVAGANKTINFFSKPAPYWLRLTRQGNWFFGYYSFNGLSFSFVTAKMIPLGSCLEVGFGAFTNFNGTPADAVFTNVSFSGGSLPIAQLPVETATPAARERNISLYPNPAREVLTLARTRTSEQKPGEGVMPTPSGRLEVRLRNQLGQILETREWLPDESNLEWAVSQLAPGLYSIEVLEEGQAPVVLRFVRAE
ncbi:MAG: HYR domain-containing protein [Lewinellaceae bacterium]|nr:HYR domain-containing protein [Lewinellaceae bacterium]